jgi:P27 family predicted phage terminase small subunit
MGARGPHKKPKPLAIAGSIQPSKEFDASPPGELQQSGRTAWAETIAALQELGLLHFADRSALTAYCVAHDRIDEYESILIKDGEFYCGPNGAVCLHPAVKRREIEERRITDFQKQYGMTAVSRDNLNVGDKKKSAPSLPQRKRG